MTWLKKAELSEQVRQIAEKLAQERYGVSLDALQHIQRREIILAAEQQVEAEAPSAPATEYTDEYKDFNALSYILLSKAIPLDQVNACINRNAPVKTIEDLARVNADLFKLADQYNIPRTWLLEQVKKRRQVEGSKGGIKMSWLFKQAADGPELGRELPTRTRPDKGGPLDGPEGMDLPPEGAAPPMGGKPPMGKGPMPGGKPPMGGPAKPPMGGPGGGKPAGLDEIKMMLDKGDLQGALEGLKKLLPGGGDKPAAPPHKAPNLGKPPAPKPAPAKEEPKDQAPKPEEKKEEPAGAPKGARNLMICGSCNVALEAHCPSCDTALTSKATKEDAAPESEDGKNPQLGEKKEDADPALQGGRHL